MIMSFIKMSSSNFNFLKSNQPQLAELGQQAEYYTYSDPQSAVMKLRCFSELYVGFVYEELNLPTYGAKSFFERLDNTVFKNAVEKCVVDKLHAIRLKGNLAAHVGGVSIDDAIWLVKEAFFLGGWLYLAYHDGSIEDLPKYQEPLPVKPEHVELQHDKKRLKEALDLQTADLQQAKDELAAAEASQQKAQAEIDALNIEVDQVKLFAIKEAGQRAVASYDFEPEETNRRIHIDDVFAEYQLTDGQAELVKELDEFFISRDDKVFLLKGYAGTGKTFITKGLTEYFRAIGRNYILAAPTGKASKVIATKTGSPAYTIHKTIYSFKDIGEYRDEGIEGTQTYKFYSKLAVNEHSVDTVYVIDESSMISDIYNEAEFFRFGSGYLLRDLLEFINLDHNDHNKKVIFIGDDAQLPPIGMKVSPALDMQYLKTHYNLQPLSYELTEVVRQKADSGVMHNSIMMRKALKEDVFNQLVFDMKHDDIEHVEYVDLIPRYLESCNNKINAESIIIAHSNADVAEYNRCVRKHFFPTCTEVVCGDKVMAVTNSNAGGFFISNGDFGIIRRVMGLSEVREVLLKRRSPETEKVETFIITLKFRDVEVGFKELDGTAHFFNAKIVENLLYSDQPTLSSDENKALYVDFCIRHSELRPKTTEFKETLRSDKYFNALRLKFGYAITCHKAQGSEWNHVFVKCKTHQGQLSANYFRWLYTAITRTAKKLYLLDEPHIALGSDIEIVNAQNLPWLLDENEKGAHIRQPNPAQIEKQEAAHDISTDNETFGIPPNAGILISILGAVRQVIENTEISITNIQHQQYQEAYTFNKGSEFSRINLVYNSKNTVTSISSPQPAALATDITTLLQPLKGRVIFDITRSQHEDNFEFDEPFMEQLYDRLKGVCDESDINISNIKSMQNCQRYIFEKTGETGVLDIYYDGKKKFTKCIPQQNGTTSQDLMKNLIIIVGAGLS